MTNGKFITAVACVLAVNSAQGDVVLIRNRSLQTELTARDYSDLYLGLTKKHEIRLLTQDKDQTTEIEFQSKFLKKSATEMKQIWSVQVFSGNRAPLVLSNDRAVFDYVKTHEDAVGYVATDFFKKASQTEPENPVLMFKVTP